MDDGRSRYCPKGPSDEEQLGRHDQVNNEIAVGYASEHLRLRQRPEYRRAVK